MATVYSHPEEIKLPVLNFTNIKGYGSECDKFCNELAEYLKKRNPAQKNVGELIDFPVADGKAMYMVAAMKPVQLIHIPIYDAWEYQYANRLTAKDITLKVKNAQAIKKLFAK